MGQRNYWPSKLPINLKKDICKKTSIFLFRKKNTSINGG